MEDLEFIRYCEVHCETQRAGYVLMGKCEYSKIAKDYFIQEIATQVLDLNNALDPTSAKVLNVLEIAANSYRYSIGPYTRIEFCDLD